MSGAAARGWLGLLLLLPAACTCPTPVERWDTPQATLDLWQARLCRDQSEGEYACLSRDFQKSFGGWENYFAARRALLERDPVAAWLLSHADLSEHVAGASFDPDGQHAALVLRSGDTSITVSFDREAWVTASWDDGHSVTARQRVPLDALVVLDDASAGQWLSLERPPLSDAARLTEVRVANRWLIAGLTGLQAAGAPVP